MRKVFFAALLLITVSFAQESTINSESAIEKILFVRSDVPLKTSGINLVEKNLTEASGAVAADYMNFLDFPSYLAIGATNSESLAYSGGLYVASELSALNVTLLYGLRFDNITSKDTTIGARAFGSDSALVCRLARSFAKGVRDGGLRCIGIASNMTEEKVGCVLGIDGLVMDDKNAIKPLRDAGFEGAIITPLITENVEQSVKDAVLSGYDMVQIRSTGVEEAKAGIKSAVDGGADIQSAVGRAAALSEKLPVNAKADSDTPARVARSAISLVMGDKVPIPQDKTAGVITDNEKLMSEIKKLREDVSFYGYDTYELKDYMVLCIEGDKGRMLIPQLTSELGDRLIILSLGFPMDVFYYPEIKNYVTTYGNDSCSLRTAAETLFGSNVPVGRFPLRAPRTKIMDIDYATEGKKELKALEGSSSDALLFNAGYYPEKRMVKVGLSPGFAGLFFANSTVGASFPSPMKSGSAKVQVEFNVGMRGMIDNALTSGSFEVIAGIRDLTTGESYGTQVIYRNATKEEIAQNLTATVNATLTQGHRYFAYIEARAKQDATLLITGKIDFWGDDYGVWYDKITVWV